jgi:NADP-dependent 3-hydroxy acid dehydrogenase YdfG
MTAPNPPASAPPLAGRTAVVTGASRGIGLAVAEELQAAGAHVVRLARSLRDTGADRRTDFACDVTDPAQVERAARRVLDQRGAPDILVNNAGGFLLKPIGETTPDEFAGQLRDNLAGPFIVLRAFLPAMLARGKGHVITLGSVADHRAFPANAAYAASKYGVRGLHEVLVEEVAGTGLRATLVSPGPVDTEIWDPINPDARAGFTRRADMLRVEDVADLVRYVVTRPPHVAIPLIHIEPRR